MDKFKAYAVTTLPTTNINTKGLYFVKGTGETVFTMYIRDNSNTNWVTLGVTGSISSVNNITTPSVQLELSLSPAGVLSITGGTTTIDLDTIYAKNDDVVKLTGNQTIAGIKTFSSSPIVPVATTAAQAIRKSQLDSEVNDLQIQINNITNTIVEGMRTPNPIDCSSNPDYPASERGDGYVVTVEGRIGGPSGIIVRKGAEIRCIETNAGGTHAAVGDKFYILEADLDQATETVPGFAKIATQPIASAGTNDTDIMTPKKTAQVIAEAIADIDTSGSVKYTVQTPTAPQKLQARTNIGAADDEAVVKLTGAQTVAGVKTFSSSPKIPNAVANNEPVALGQLNTITDGKYVRFDNATQGLTGTQQTNARTNIDAASVDDVSWGAKDW